jgi:prophage maintenance system killer protein
VDEPGFFHVGSELINYAPQSGSAIDAPLFPDTTAFKNWLLARLPAATAQEYKDSPVSIFRTEVVGVVRMGGALVPGVNRPFSFTSSQSQGDLADKLYDGLMSRLDSDIDYLVFSSWEQTTGHLLEVAKTILTVAAIGLNTVIPGTGTLLSRIGLFMANLALDGAYVAASLTQAHMADRPEDAAAFRNEAILAGILGGVGTLASAAPLTRQGITDALALYHRTKSATHTFIPQALRSVTWSRLADNVKINLLVDSMKGSEPARNLALLTTPEVVEHSIRQNLLLDSLGTARTRFAWGELAFEQAQVQRRLQSDLARLSEVNGHIHRLLDAPPAVPRQTLPGEPELAAANWITGNSRSAADPESVSELQARIRSALSQNRQADLLDIHTIDSLHSAVYQPAAGQVEAGEALFAAIVRYHPYGDGNGRTARTLYALAQLNKQESSFKALTTHAEHMLSPPMPSITF